MIKGVTRERIQVPRVRLVTTLMYHSVADEKGRTDPGADTVYTISARQFAEHLQQVASSGLPVSTLSDLATPNLTTDVTTPGQRITPEIDGVRYRRGLVSPREHAVVLTFNEGTASHLDSVLHMLWEHNMPGEFFIYPAKVGRAGYLSWNELRGMASAGMSIQSHGYTQRYLNDLDDAAVANELLRSKKMIEDRIGYPVTVFAAPGGRVNDFIAALARRVGYRAVCGSRPGHWRPQSATRIIPRIAVRASTSAEDIGNWINHRRMALTAQAGRYRVLQAARWALGNNVYDHLRDRYLGGS